MPGGATLHSIMSPHGPDRNGYEAGSSAELKPEVIATGTQAFMFESFRSVKVWRERKGESRFRVYSL